jgi:ribosome-associated protein
MAEDLIVDRARVVPGSALEVRTARASGPGGQHVNRTESKVQLRLDPSRVPWLDERTAARLRTLAGRSVDGQGGILVVSQEQRDQPQNLQRAREKLASLLRQALVRPKRRKGAAPSKQAKARGHQGRTPTRTGRLGTKSRQFFSLRVGLLHTRTG